jgi:hypothetical protein
MLQYDWLLSGHMIIKEMFYIPIKLKPELARASMEVNMSVTKTEMSNSVHTARFWNNLHQVI